MKKALLLSACALGSCICGYADEVFEGPLTKVWESAAIASNGNNTRQATVIGGKFYASNYSTGNVEVWGENGKEEGSEIYLGKTATGTNITRDDANNIIVRKGTFPNAFQGANNTALTIITPSGEQHDVNITLNEQRCDFFGKASGDVMSAEGGDLYVMPTWSSSFYTIHIANGKDVTITTQYIGDDLTNAAYASVLPPSPNAKIGTTATLSQFKPGELALKSSYYTVGGNTIFHFTWDGTKFVHDGFYVTPGQVGQSGFAEFTLNDVDYIVYPTGSNMVDGFAIAKKEIRTSPETLESDIDNYRVAIKYAKSDENWVLAYPAPGIYANHYDVEVKDGKAYIYTYCSTKVLAKYEFAPSTTGIESISDNVNAPVEYYNLQGVKVQNPEKGIYIMRQGNKATKIVK